MVIFDFQLILNLISLCSENSVYYTFQNFIYHFISRNLVDQWGQTFKDDLLIITKTFLKIIFLMCVLGVNLVSI